MSIDLHAIIRRPLSTEKSIRMMETQNTLIFAVDARATKPEIKQAMELVFKAKVRRVNTYIHKKGEKRAYVKFSPETPAIDIATNLGLL